jgi:hypothetical protein
MRCAAETSGASPLARAACTDTSTNWIGSRDSRMRSRISASAKPDCGANGRSEDDNTSTCLGSPRARADSGNRSSNTTSRAVLPQKKESTFRCCHTCELAGAREAPSERIRIATTGGRHQWHRRRDGYCSDSTEQPIVTMSADAPSCSRWLRTSRRPAADAMW